MNILSIIPFLSFVVNLILGSFVFGLNPYSKTNRAYSIFAFNFAFWAFINFLEWNFHSQKILHFFAHIEPFAWLPTTFLVLRFIYILIKRRYDLVYHIIKISVILWLLISAVTGCLIEGFSSAYWGNLVIVKKLYFPAIVMTSLIPALWGFYIIRKASKTVIDSSFNTHLNYLTTGTAIMYVLVISESVLKPTLLRNGPLPYAATFLLIIQSMRWMVMWSWFYLMIMPFMNGIQCANRLREIDPNVKIIFISGYSGELSPSEYDIISTPTTCSKLLCKPFTIEQLSHVIKEMIEG